MRTIDKGLAYTLRKRVRRSEKSCRAHIHRTERVTPFVGVVTERIFRYVEMIAVTALISIAVSRSPAWINISVLAFFTALTSFYIGVPLLRTLALWMVKAGRLPVIAAGGITMAGICWATGTLTRNLVDLIETFMRAG